MFKCVEQTCDGLWALKLVQTIPVVYHLALLTCVVLAPDCLCPCLGREMRGWIHRNCALFFSLSSPRVNDY
jgi:hypothetical protein